MPKPKEYDPYLDLVGDSTDSSRPQVFNVSGLAARLCVSRQTLHRWRLAGYLPAPFYSEARVSLWLVDTIEKWIADGAPWSDVDQAKKTRATLGGTSGLQAFIKPEIRAH